MVCFRISRGILHKESTVTITVLSKPNCVQCSATYRKLDAEKLDYEVEDVYAEENMVTIQTLKHMSAPVVLVRDESGSIIDHWAGFNPTKITEVASRLKAA